MEDHVLAFYHYCTANLWLLENSTEIGTFHELLSNRPVRFILWHSTKTASACVFAFYLPVLYGSTMHLLQIYKDLQPFHMPFMQQQGLGFCLVHPWFQMLWCTVKLGSKGSKEACSRIFRQGIKLELMQVSVSEFHRSWGSRVLINCLKVKAVRRECRQSEHRICRSLNALQL